MRCCGGLVFSWWKGGAGAYITAKITYVLYPMEEKETGVIITTWETG
jgi:hypothetical protein